MTHIKDYKKTNYKRTIEADKESRKELMDLMFEKIDKNLHDWELEYINDNDRYIFKYTTDNYDLHIEGGIRDDLIFFLKENGDTININKYEIDQILVILFYSLSIPCLFLLIPALSQLSVGWGYIPMIIFQILFSIFSIKSFLSKTKLFRLLKKEYIRRNREELRQRIQNINIQPIENIENHPMDRWISL